MTTPLEGSDRPSGRDIFEASYSGAQERPFIPRLRSDHYSYHPLARSLQQFRQEEGEENRDKRLHTLWKKLPHKGNHISTKEIEASSVPVIEHAALTKERAETLTKIYEDELVRRCAEEEEDPSSPVTWKDFKKYAEEKEAGGYS